MPVRQLISIAAISVFGLLAPGQVNAQDHTCVTEREQLDRLIGTLDLANHEVLTDLYGCPNNDPCLVAAVLRQAAVENGLPADLMFTTRHSGNRSIVRPARAAGSRARRR